MSTANWHVHVVELKKLLSQLDAYVQLKDWNNAHIISQKIQFKVKMYPVYEQEDVERMKCK